MADNNKKKSTDTTTPTLDLSGLKGVQGLPTNVGPGFYSPPGAGGASTPSSSSSGSVNDFLHALASAPPEKQAQIIISGLNYGQEQNPNADLINTLMQVVGKLPAGQATTVLKDLPAGTTLSGDLSKALQGESVQNILAGNKAAVNPSSGSGYDPLSIGQFSQSVVQPFLQSEQSNYDQGLNALASQMNQTIANAPANIKALWGPAANTLNTSYQNLNRAAATEAVAAPQWDSMVSALTNAVNQYKLAQGVYQLAPYSSQIFQTGQIPSSIGGLTPGANGLLPPPNLTPTTNG